MGDKGNSTTSTGDPATKNLRRDVAEDYLRPRMPGYFDQYDRLFEPAPQEIPGLTEGQEQIRQFQGQRAFGPILNQDELAAREQYNQMLGTGAGTSAYERAAMDAARRAVEAQAGLSGVGNSTMLQDETAAAFAPILAQGMQMRGQAAQSLQGLGDTEAQRQSQFLSEFGQSEEAARGIDAQRGEAQYLDLLRRQGLLSQSTLGILGITPGAQISKTSTSGGGMTVICTELYLQGRLDDALYDADCLFGSRLSPQTMRGYHRWGVPVARAMRRSRLITSILTPFVRAAATEMRARVFLGYKGSFLGSLILDIGIPLCRWLGRTRLSEVKCYG